jgi:hypothetical protein
MSDQSSSQDTNANPTPGRQSNAPKEGAWEVQNLPFTKDVQVLGFLQLCADRRFHSVLQAYFKEDAGLESDTDYWIHADAGGTPKMESQRTAPDYCYNQKGVRLMGWSAHGDGCGGFGEQVPDEVIERALLDVFTRQRERYRDAEHFCYFVKIKKEGDKEETVVYCMKGGKGSA